LLAAAWASAAAAAAPSVLITNLPAYGSYDNLGGVVLNAEPASQKLAVFIYVPGAGWWSKPTCPGQPLTSIQADGTWTTDITTGGTDPLATRVAALLVSSSYSEPCVLGLEHIPTNIFARALASVVVTRPHPGKRWLAFSGYDWWVKASAGAVGPGPNYFSDSSHNVWVDAEGQLHLRITNRSNQWQCAEVVSARTFGYGFYRFELASPVDTLDANAILGLFTWSDDPAYHYREMDIECARWSNPSDPNNIQFIVQPDLNGHKVRFAVPEGVTHSTHWFKWETNRVTFQSLRGGFVPNPLPSQILNTWGYVLAVPRTGDENVRLNLWLNKGWPPAGGQEVEMVVRSFEFDPLGPALPAVITNVMRLPDGRVSFSIQTQPDRRYQVQTSTNLVQWNSLARFLATNTVVEFLDPEAGEFGQRYYRVLTSPAGP